MVHRMQRGNRAIMSRFSFILSLVFVAVSGPAFGQNGAPLARNILPDLNALARSHLTPTGKPCLVLRGHVEGQTLNKNIFEHSVLATNNCGQNIKVKVCYHNSEDCITVDVPPYGKKDTVLGIYPALKDFRYDAKEQF
jgi:hypothetical protein